MEGGRYSPIPQFESAIRSPVVSPGFVTKPSAQSKRAMENGAPAVRLESSPRRGEPSPPCRPDDPPVAYVRRRVIESSTAFVKVGHPPNPVRLRTEFGGRHG